MLTVSKDRAFLAYILSIFIEGAGHVVIGKILRGIGIFLAGVITWIIAFLVIPFPLGILIVIGYWIWQIYDLHRIITSSRRIQS
jgi:TM2 domain-containing membrane protein YozV